VPRARSPRARAPALASEKNIARKVRRPKRAARNGRKVRLGGPEPNDAWVVQPQAPTHLHKPTFARGDHVTRPLHIAPVGHGDHELRAAGECNNRGVVVPSALASDVMDDRQRRGEPRKGTHHGIGEDSVYAPHEAREPHSRDGSSDPRQHQRARRPCSVDSRGCVTREISASGFRVSVRWRRLHRPNPSLCSGEACAWSLLGRWNRSLPGATPLSRRGGNAP